MRPPFVCWGLPALASHESQELPMRGFQGTQAPPRRQEGSEAVLKRVAVTVVLVILLNLAFKAIRLAWTLFSLISWHKRWTKATKDDPDA